VKLVKEIVLPFGKILSLFLVMGFLVFPIDLLSQDHTLSESHQMDPLNPEYIPGELIVKFAPDLNLRFEKSSYILQCGIESIDKYFDFYQVHLAENLVVKNLSSDRFVAEHQYVYNLKFDSGIDPKHFCDLLSLDSSIVYAEPNYLIYSMHTYPNDALYQSGEQWYIDEINATSAWDSVTCDTTQIVGIIDSGVDWDHPDLDGNIWRNRGELPDNGLDDDGNGFVDDVRGWDFTTNSNDPDDDNGHGTHVAGVVAAETDNYVGIAGIAWNARIMPIKVLTGTGHGNTAWLTSAIYYAASNGATVVNMSLGTYGESQAVKDALLFAYDTLTLVGAAGNDYLKVDTISPPNQEYGPMFPGCYPFVIGVEAANPDGSIAGFSNFDPSGFSKTANPDGFNYEIIAPGVNIFSTFPGGGYRSLTGTSMASPVVTGAIALLKDFIPGISNEEIFARLIQFSPSGHLKIPNILHSRLEPDVFNVEYALIDTVGDADNDGQADSDEVFDMWFTVKNAGGYADSVWAKLRLNYAGDTSLVNILDSTSYIGDLDSAGFHNEIPSYTTLTGEMDPFRVYIKPGVINEKDIVFDYEIGAKNGSSSFGSFYLTIQNGEELHGLLDTAFTLTPDKLWLVNQSFKITQTGVLNILPGTHLKINKSIVQNGTIYACGTPDSNIYIYGPYGMIAQDHGSSYCYFEHAVFEDVATFSSGHLNCDYCLFHNYDNAICSNTGFDFWHCIITNTTADAFSWGGGIVEYCNFDNIPGGVIGQSGTARYCNFVNRTGPFAGVHISGFYKNNFITSHGNIVYKGQGGPDYDYFPDHYWGTTRSDIIDGIIYDFWDDPGSPLVIYEPKLNAPCDSAHGVVWKVLINNIDPQDEYLDPIGVGRQKFDVYFNKAMDTLFNPLLTFGVRDPLTQHVVEEDAYWSSDSTIWTAYYDVTVETGDGMNYIRVANAVDTAGFLIPNENTMRFGFNIQAASSSSIQFLATPGIGKVYLEWPFYYTEDFFGYNMYRFTRIDSVTTSDTLLINQEIIEDSVFTDFNVTPDITYFYCYKTVGTDFKEGGFSKVISVIPLSSANGDANGDLSVTVLDITSIISYILEEDPQPFLFEAADVNYDGNINVLDMVLVIQMIMGQKDYSQDINTIVPEYLDYSSQGMLLESKGQIAAMQFELKGTSSKDQRIFSMTEGLEMVYSVKKDKIIGVLFTYSNHSFKAGDLELLCLSPALEVSSLNKVLASNPEGNPVPIKTSKIPEPVQEIQSLTCSPNPFLNTSRVRFGIPDESVYEFRIFDQLGNTVFYKSNYQVNGSPISIDWCPGTMDGNKLSAGVYIGSLKIKDHHSGKVLSSESVKMILLK